MRDIESVASSRTLDALGMTNAFLVDADAVERMTRSKTIEAKYPMKGVGWNPASFVMPKIMKNAVMPAVNDANNISYALFFA